jgi:radical SAM superfamily enzyme YgiQ (UPF0313 family)
VNGPGERALPYLLDCMGNGGVAKGTILDGWKLGIGDSHGRASGVIDYSRYTANRGLAGFETQKGCRGVCTYCAEANHPVIFKNTERVIDEIAELVNRGVTDFHLCDTEFNQDLEHSKAFLRALIGRKLSLKWALYLKTDPYDGELFSLIAESGAHLVTVSVPTGARSVENAGEICRLAKARGVKIAVDYLCGFPGQTAENVRVDLDAFREMAPGTVGINAYFRLFHCITVTRQIIGSPDHRRHMLGEIEGNPDMVHPVFYNHLSVETLRELIDGDPLFRIEGFERTSNYERLAGG